VHFLKTGAETARRLDRDDVFWRGRLLWAVLEVALWTDGMDPGVVVAEKPALESGGPAAESVGLDVPAYRI
jgi:hypothetical protein